MAKIRFTALEKYELIQEFLQSGQSREAFRREHHLYNMSIKRICPLKDGYICITIRALMDSNN